MNYYYRYYFSVTVGGKRIKFHVCGNNIYSAQTKVRKLYPGAEKINFMYSEKMG